MMFSADLFAEISVLNLVLVTIVQCCKLLFVQKCLSVLVTRPSDPEMGRCSSMECVWKCVALFISIICSLILSRHQPVNFNGSRINGTVNAVQILLKSHREIVFRIM
jgi:hypothetical protein